MKTKINLYLVIMTKNLRFTRERVASYLTRLQALVIKSYESTDNFVFRRSVAIVLDEFQRYIDLTGKPLINQLCIENVPAGVGPAPAVGTEYHIEAVECDL